MNETLKRFDPAVDKKILIVLSGIIWLVIGLYLCKLATDWLSLASGPLRTWPAIAGAGLALGIYTFGFVKLVNRNLERILSKPGKVCIFGFQPWKSYIIIIIMISMGRFLRQSPLPKHYLAIIYIGFGGAMIMSSFRYLRAASTAALR